MNDRLTFEEHPWKRACSQIAEQDLGNIEQIIIQCVCPAGTIQAAQQKWEECVQDLAGAAEAFNLQEGQRVISGIGVFGPNHTIVRMFFDEGAQDICENFEIVTAKALLVWKPINTNQGHLLAENSYFVECRQPYAEELAGVPNSESRAGGAV